MNSNTPTDKIQTTGTVVSWLVVYAAVAMVFFFVAFIRSNSSSGEHGSLERLASGGGPFLVFTILAATLVAFVLSLVALVRSPRQFILSPRWIICSIGIVLVAAAALLTCFLAAFIAVQNP